MNATCPRPSRRLAAAALLLCAAASADEATKAVQPALTVATVTPQVVDWPRTLTATGTIAPWQEAVIGPEIDGYRLTAVLVELGDVVQKGQLLVSIASDTVAAELAQSRAAVAEAQAMLAEAKANGERARQLQPGGTISAQQVTQYLTAEQTAAARLGAAHARVQADELRLAQTRVVAPDDGVISARNATVGSLAQPGQELLRLIRGGRLEWRAEVTAAELARVQPGATATVIAANGNRVPGKVRLVAPTVDPRTRTALIYVDLPPQADVRAGMFARGEFELGRAAALTLPQSAVLLRDGFAYVFRVQEDSRVAQVKVAVDRRAGDRIEIGGGLEPDARVVATGAGFLNDGDLVRVVDTPR